MKKIYIGKTALKSQRNGCKHPKRSSFHDHKDDIRKRLSYTTHKLEMVEAEFDSTRQYLETELRRAQEELEKFTEKLRRCVCCQIIGWEHKHASFLLSCYQRDRPTSQK
ncbi:hypothetical protein ATANTOWER_007837 [Ataeniobius toweri]|uniref:Uncharacterized protein n=1 Tax=Ataeniobius toweri TaxID=208326 RepID=A0ABU7BH03_9TELE|nr:hypothetical protein [Ataeniobius toweri]